MAYTLRHDQELLAENRRRITARLATETDPAKIAKLVSGLAQMDAYADGYNDIHGSDGEEGTTIYAQGGIAKATAILEDVDA